MNTSCENLEAGQDLLELYQEWKRLSVAEADAIQRAAWRQVDLCQGGKYQLQTRILEAREQLITELNMLGLNRDSVEDQIRIIVDELILMETKNSELIDIQRKALQQEKDSLDRSSRNLRQVHRAYSSERTAAWSSYS